MSEESFQRARRNEEFRQEYVDSIDLDNSRKYVRSITYRPEGPPISFSLLDLESFSTNEAPAYMSTVPSFLSRVLKIKGLQSKILVYPRIFEHDLIQTEEDFLNGLIDHEVFHAQQYYESPECVRYPESTEIAALKNQLAAIESGLRNPSSEIHSGVKKQLEKLTKGTTLKQLARTLTHHSFSP